jgi:hypothetical protein
MVKFEFARLEAAHQPPGSPDTRPFERFRNLAIIKVEIAPILRDLGKRQIEEGFAFVRLATMPGRSVALGILFAISPTLALAGPGSTFQITGTYANSSGSPTTPFQVLILL